MKAIIEIAPSGSAFSAARHQLKAAEASPAYGADYTLSFESAKALFTELTPARIDLHLYCIYATYLSIFLTGVFNSAISPIQIS